MNTMDTQFRARIGFLASHSGSNMQSIIDACKSGRLQADPVVVISNNGNSGALDRAYSEGIPAFYISSKNYPDAEVEDKAIRDVLIKHQVNLIVLAGFMKKIGPVTLDEFRGRILNIHPALLPKHGGKGMYGKFVHEQVLASGDKQTGVTVHLVTGDYDRGPILAQKIVPVLEGDTVESLANRVLEVEHQIYTETIADIISGAIQLPQS